MSVLTEKHLAKASTNRQVILLTHTDRRTCMKTVSTAQPSYRGGICIINDADIVPGHSIRHTYIRPDDSAKEYLQ